MPRNRSEKTPPTEAPSTQEAIYAFRHRQPTSRELRRDSRARRRAARRPQNMADAANELLRLWESAFPLNAGNTTGPNSSLDEASAEALRLRVKLQKERLERSEPLVSQLQAEVSALKTQNKRLSELHTRRWTRAAFFSLFTAFIGSLIGFTIGLQVVS